MVIPVVDHPLFNLWPTLQEAVLALQSSRTSRPLGITGKATESFLHTMADSALRLRRDAKPGPGGIVRPSSSLKHVLNTSEFNPALILPM